MKAKVIKTGEIVEVYHEPQHGQITNIYKEAVLVNGRMWDETELDFNCITKANEASEKIYLFEDPITETPDDRWLTHRSCDSDIEYTRTDAFIEKACEWLRTHSEDDYFELIADANYRGAGNLNKKRMVEDFRKYLEE